MTLPPLLLAASLAVAAPGPDSARMTPVVRAVQRASPYVVSIETESVSADPFSIWRGAQVQSGAGSGVIIDSDGVVLTNAHVVSGARSIRVHAADGREWPASILGMETDLDLAVLELQGAGGLSTISMGTSRDLLPGETVIAIGNPFGLGQTVTTGVVSQAERELEIRAGVSQTWIQTDAAINPGNSGGALVNLDGELVGINTAIFARAEGIGFAIPVDRALKVARDLVDYGAVDAPWLGVDVSDISRRRLQGTPLESGAVAVGRVHPGGPADRAGLQEYDLLYEIEGRPILSRADLNAFLAELQPGAVLRVRYLRGGSSRAAELETTRVPRDAGERVLSEVLGIGVSEVRGALVVTSMEPAGAWAQRGLRVGDRILAVDAHQVRRVEDLEQALERSKASHRGAAAFTVARGRAHGTLTLPI